MRKLVAGAAIAALALPAAALATQSPKRNTNCAADRDVTTLTNRDIIDPGFSATEAKVCMTTSVVHKHGIVIAHSGHITCRVSNPAWECANPTFTWARKRGQNVVASGQYEIRPKASTGGIFCVDLMTHWYAYGSIPPHTTGDVVYEFVTSCNATPPTQPYGF
jgi:hypothetical protein